MRPSRLANALVLLGRFLADTVKGGISTAWLILRPGPHPTPTVVRMCFSGINDTGARLLAALVTLTPGSAAIGLDLERREMLLHLLDDSDTDATAAGIRRRFERPLQLLFPEGEVDR